MPRKTAKHEEKKNTSIGALWINEGKNIKYLAGEIEVDGTKTKIVVFKNSYKTEEKHPDYRIYLRNTKAEEPAEEDLPF